MDSYVNMNNNDQIVYRNSSVISQHSQMNDVEQDICFPLKRTSTTDIAKQQQEVFAGQRDGTSQQQKDRNIIDLNQIDLFKQGTNNGTLLFTTMNTPIPSNKQHFQKGIQLMKEQQQPNMGTTTNDSISTITSNYNASNERDRFHYYHLDIGFVSSPSFLGLCTDSLNLQDLLIKDSYWIDITSPSHEEMKLLSKVFNIHPLTTEDIMSREIREKCDVFRHYIFVCYRAFIYHHQQNQQLLQPVTFYNIITQKYILTFHFGNVPHIYQVQQRVKQLENYIEIIPDWINYAVMDEITDSFAPLVQQIESEVDAIDDLVLLYKTDQSDMILRIGTCRKKVIQMVRLLGTKIEVVRGLIKRISDDNANGVLSSTISTAASTIFTSPSTSSQHQSPTAIDEKVPVHNERADVAINDEKKIYPDVVLYLGDVQDHILTMLQNLSHYETVLSRSESNYLARISIELTQTSNSTNHVIGRLTIFATVLLPMNLVTGLWGMNVKVPGKDYDNLIYFFWIVFSLVIFAIMSLTVAKKIKLI
ncbi:hypothetical protein BDF20DRAFT_864691 [Mycotypha africana]|uniref:uncharacterized protein n=1 Tax=Mycotypha africana TaxID=64632 RepID=UPI002300FA2F|nr:uncharacterized protein BDF20DRAFT_864691 [Mycotypha africana]KAI8982053.1 hypothetical protein BDF20DRAFT_864691 [Mycotypha africana]